MEVTAGYNRILPQGVTARLHCLLSLYHLSSVCGVACGGQRSKSGVFPSFSLSSVLSQGLSWRLDLTIQEEYQAWLWDMRTSTLGSYVGSGDLHSGPLPVWQAPYRQSHPQVPSAGPLNC